MSILDKFTVTPLLYACLALLVISGGLGVALKLKSADLAVAQQRVVAVITERDAWKDKAGQYATANRAFDSAFKKLAVELERQQSESNRIAAASRKAVIAAQADAVDADRALKRFAAKFQAESRKPACQRALETMAASCPAMGDY